MRLTTVILIASLMQVSAATLAQKITISKSGAPLKTVLKELRQQSGYDFVVTDEVLAEAKRVSVTLKQIDFEDALKEIFKDQALTYVIRNTTVVVSKKEPSLLDKLASVIQSVAKDLTVRGKVVDQDGKPLPNASIRVKGKNAVINTNQNGEFEIKDVAEDAVLMVSYVGFKTLEISLKDAVMPLEIKLNVATGELEEVNVTYSTGYQDIPKERATGSFVQIDNETFNRRVSANVLDRLYDVTSGLNFQKGTLASSNQSPLTIRGISTVNSNMAPLIVVDGFPYSGQITNLNPNDIENVTVLKDANAASIWGVQSGNGVVVITTKTGKYNQPLKVGFNSNVTIGEKDRIFRAPIMSSKEVIEFQRKLFANGYYNGYDDLFPSMKLFPAVPEAIEIMLAQKKGALSTTEAERQLAILENTDVRKDIDKYLLQNSISQQYALNFSEGSNSNNFYGSVGYDKTRSSNVGDESRRVTIRLNNTFRPVKNLEVSAFVNYAPTESKNNALSSLLPNGSGTAPYAKLADEFGNPLEVQHPLYLRSKYTDTAAYPALLDWKYRPLQELNNSNNVSKQNELRIGAGLNYKVLDGINFDLKYQYQALNNENVNLRNINTYFTRDLINQYMTVGTNGQPKFPVPIGDILDKTERKENSWNFRTQINVNKRWNEHQLTAIAGVEYRELKSEQNTVRRYGYDPNVNSFTHVDYLTPYPIRPSFSSSQTINSIDKINGTINRYASLYLNAGYNLKDKYSLTVSGRIDGSNFYGIKANQRRVPLWSVGLGWDMSKEDFFDVAWLNFLKFRATYGYNGLTNNAASAYALIAFGTNNEIQARSAQLASPPNPQLRWEKQRMMNIGIDFSLREDRIGGSIEYYQKKNTDLISPITAIPSSGVATYTGNNASTKGEGVDLYINTINIKARDFYWKSNVLFSYNTDKVTSYQILSTLISDYLRGSNPIIGKPLFQYYGYNWAGLDPMTGRSRAYAQGAISDASTVSSKAKPEDLFLAGRRTPSIFGSIRNSFSYKRLELSFILGYKFNYFFKRSSFNYATLVTNWGGHSDYAQRWQKPGDENITNIPAIPPSYNATDLSSEIYLNSSALLEKADHIRLQDISLSYSINRLNNKKLPFSNIRFYTYLNNLGVVWTSNSQHIDPDVTAGGIPPSRTLAFGINVNL